MTLKTVNAYAKQLYVLILSVTIVILKQYRMSSAIICSGPFFFGKFLVLIGFVTHIMGSFKVLVPSTYQNTFDACSEFLLLCVFSSLRKICFKRHRYFSHF